MQRKSQKWELDTWLESKINIPVYLKFWPEKSWNNDSKHDSNTQGLHDHSWHIFCIESICSQACKNAINKTVKAKYAVIFMVNITRSDLSHAHAGRTRDANSSGTHTNLSIAMQCHQWSKTPQCPLNLFTRLSHGV